MIVKVQIVLTITIIIRRISNEAMALFLRSRWFIFRLVLCYCLEKGNNLWLVAYVHYIQEGKKNPNGSRTRWPGGPPFLTTTGGRDGSNRCTVRSGLTTTVTVQYLQFRIFFGLLSAAIQRLIRAQKYDVNAVFSLTIPWADTSTSAVGGVLHILRALVPSHNVMKNSERKWVYSVIFLPRNELANKRGETLFRSTRNGE